MSPRITLRSISTTAGFLSQCHVEFAPGLTCIIGARGTCKSTLVESIRFAFDEDSERIASLEGRDANVGKPWHGLIRSTLGAGSIQCEVERTAEAGSRNFLIEREVGAEPRLFLDGIREHTDEGLLGEIEIYSQGDLQEIAEDSQGTRRLKLIDRPNARQVEQLQGERADHTNDLSALGGELRDIRQAAAALRQRTAPLKELKEQLRAAEASAPTPSEALAAERELYEQRRDVIRTLRRTEEVKRLAAEHEDVFGRLLADLHRIKAELEATDLAERARSVGEFDVIMSAVGQIVAALETISEAELEVAIDALDREFDDLSQNFFELRQKEQRVNAAIKQQQAIRTQIAALEVLKRQLDDLIDQEATLLLERTRLRAEIAQIDDKMFDLRMAEIESINHEHTGIVHLTLKSGLGSPDYVQAISDLLSGSRARLQDDLATDLGTTLSPSQLVDAVENEEGKNLAEILDRDLGQMNRVVAHLADHPDLYRLEAMEPAAELEITFYDDGEAKPVASLSKGQRATALLPLILRPLDYPLVIDQPEDDLDNSFIYRRLVKLLSDLRLKRQIILVTHNANIPVLGGADRVVVMEMASPSSAAAPKIGSVDERKEEILDLLEGGPEAFLRREASYGDLLHSRASEAN